MRAFRLIRRPVELPRRCEVQLPEADRDRHHLGPAPVGVAQGFFRIHPSARVGAVGWHDRMQRHSPRNAPKDLYRPTEITRSFPPPTTVGGGGLPALARGKVSEVAPYSTTTRIRLGRVKIDVSPVRGGKGSQTVIDASEGEHRQDSRTRKDRDGSADLRS